VNRPRVVAGLELSSRQHTPKHGSGDMSGEMRLSFRAGVVIEAVQARPMDTVQRTIPLLGSVFRLGGTRDGVPGCFVRAFQAAVGFG
jgi:hypothetical protein